MDQKRGEKPKGLIVEIDRAAVRAFSFVIIIVASGWLIVNAARPKADISNTLSTIFTSNVAIKSSQIEVKQNGEIYLDQQLTKETAQRSMESDEVRLKLIDNESDYISRLDVTLHLPQPLKAEAGKPTYGVIAVHGANSQRPLLVDQQTIRFVITEIEPEATVTVFAEMPRRSMNLGAKALLNSLATATNPLIWWILGVVLPIATWIYLIVKRRSRFKTSDQSGGVIGPPSNLSPAAVGLLIYERVGQTQLAATLVAMAGRGDIQIVQTRAGYRIARKRVLENLSSAEQFLIDELRIQIGPIGQQEVIEAEMKKKLFSQKITNAYISIFTELEQRGFFATDSTRRRATIRWRGLLGIIASVVGATVIGLIVPNGSLLLPTFGGVFLSSWIVLIMASQIPLLTSIGAQERSRWLSFRNFLASPAPMPGGQNNVNYFFAWLPYAISLGVLERWIHRFNSDFINIPEWYFNEDNPSSTEIFISDLSAITEEISQTLTNAAIPQI